MKNSHSDQSTWAYICKIKVVYAFKVDIKPYRNLYLVLDLQQKTSVK